MYIEDRLFSENTEETLYSILLDEDEYTLYSEFCSLFSKDEDGINKEDLAKAAAIAAGATGVGAGVGKALQHQGKKKLKGLIGKRALQGASIGSATGSGILGGTTARDVKNINEAVENAVSNIRRGASAFGIPLNQLNWNVNMDEGTRYLYENGDRAIRRAAIRGAAGGGAGGSAIGAIEGAIEKHLKEKQLKKLVKKGGKAGLAAGTLAGAGYLAHKASKKKKKD